MNCDCGCGLKKPESKTYPETIKNTKELTDILDEVSRALQKASDRAYILGSRENYSPAHMGEIVRADLILPIKEQLARLEIIEDKIINLYSVL